jgi:hypothetical protein
MVDGIKLLEKKTAERFNPSFLKGQNHPSLVS